MSQHPELHRTHSRDSNRIQIPTADIRYTANEIPDRFHDGAKLLPSALRRFGPIEVVKHTGAWYSLNNRMLYVVKHHRLGDFEIHNVPTIEAVEVKKDTSFYENFTTQDNGMTITIRPESCNPEYDDVSMAPDKLKERTLTRTLTRTLPTS